MPFAKLDGADVAADARIADKYNAGSLHLLNAAVNDALIQLHVGNAVAQKAAGQRLLFVNGDGVSAAIKPDGRRKPRRAAAHNANAFSGFCERQVGCDKAVFIGIFDDSQLVVFGAYRAFGSRAGAGCFA